MAATARASKAKITKVGYDEARPAPVVLISGPEQFLADRAARTIRETLRERDAALEIHDIDAAGYGSGELSPWRAPHCSPNPG